MAHCSCFQRAFSTIVSGVDASSLEGDIERGTKL
jgi:hypothetical protein